MYDLTDPNLLNKITAMTPESPQIAAPTAGAGPSAPVSATAPVQGKKKGILGAIGDFFAPEAGSFWWSALHNGLSDAKFGQQQYRQGILQQAAELGKTQADTALTTAKAQREATAPIIAGNNVVVNGPDGPQFITPPQQPTETQRLIDRWKTTTDPKEKGLIGGILLKSNAPEVIALKQQAAAQTAEARAASNERHRAPPRAAASAPALPPGFRIK